MRPSLGESHTPARSTRREAGAEQRSKSAHDALKAVTLEERLTRANRVSQLHENRAALGALYPQERVASFVPPKRRTSEEPDDDTPEEETPE